MEFAPRRILSLLDLSPASATVLNWSRLFAEKFAAQLQILHVMWPPVPRAVTQDEGEVLLEEYEERRVELLRSIRAQAGEVLGQEIRFEVGVGVGHPVKVVLEHIAQSRPELIVLGSHGHDGMARSLLGSVAENVVRESAFPTLVVKPRESSSSRTALGRVLCPVDLTRVATQALDASASLAAAFGASLQVFRVLPEGAKDPQAELASLREWVPEVVRQRCPVEEAVHCGDTAEQIVVFARQHAVDLVVVGAEPRRFLEFTVMGRTTERILRHGPCPVLLLRMESESN
jgi:nucleotide-binding universal stress UspA family protein